LSKALPIKSAVDSLAGLIVSAAARALALIKQIDAIPLFKIRVTQASFLVRVFIIDPHSYLHLGPVFNFFVRLLDL
jgi:hypothetical protein